MSHAPVRGVPTRAGFTLLELLAVLLVVAVLGGIVTAVGRRAQESARTARARSELAALGTALESFRGIHGDYPRTEDPGILFESLSGRRDATGQRVQARAVLDPASFRVGGSGSTNAPAALLDPWERPYRYAYRTPVEGWANSAFVLFSVGPDGQAAALLVGGFVDGPAPENADNVYATK